MLPILYQSHNLILYSYPLLMGIGWGVAHQVFFAKVDIPTKYANLLFWGMFVFSWIGAKLFFYLNTTSLSSSILKEVSFWTGGGFVFYGGLITVLAFLLIYRQMRLPLTLQTLWAMLPALTLGHAIGRIGCFLAGCCYGALTEWGWAIHLHGGDRHPTQLIESLGLFVLAIYLMKVKAELKSFAAYFIGYGSLRFLVECLRGDEVRGFWGPLTPSQWISLGLIGLGVFVTFSNKFRGLRFNIQK